MKPLKKDLLQEEDRYMWGCGLIPHPHIYPSLLLAGGFFSEFIAFCPKPQSGMFYTVNRYTPLVRRRRDQR